MKSEINDCIAKNEFLNSLCPTFYSYTEPLNLQDMIFHFMNTIEKVNCDNILNKGINECRTNKQLFSKTVIVIMQNLDKILDFLFFNTNEITIYKKIEIKLLKMLYKKFFKLIELDGENNIKHILYNYDFENITKNIVFLTNTKSYLKRSQSKNFSGIENIFNNITKISRILRAKQSIIKNKLLNNDNLKMLFSQYMYDCSMYAIPDEYFINDYKINYRIQNKNINQILAELQDILIDCKFTNWSDYNIDTFKNIPKIHEIFKIFFKKGFFELTINNFCDIYLYYNFLIIQCYLKKFVAKKLTFFTDDTSSLRVHSFHRFCEICTKVTIQKNILGKFILNLNMSSITTIRTIRYESQKLICKKFIEFDQIYNEIICSTFSTNDIEIGRLHNVNILIINTLESIQCIKSLYELYKKSFYDFKLQCYLLLKLFSVHLYMLNKDIYMPIENLINCMNINIQEITKILLSSSDQCFENKKKTLFIQEILKKFKKYTKILENLKKDVCFIKELDISKFIYDDLVFNLYLYSININSDLTLELFSDKIPYYDLSNVFLKDNILEIKNYEDLYKKRTNKTNFQSQISDSFNPKKKWISNWTIEDKKQGKIKETENFKVDLKTKTITNKKLQEKEFDLNHCNLSIIGIKRLNSHENTSSKTTKKLKKN
ncbi:hypothetical protein NUSPORA_00558 [Nucleospora cyclopteri]